MTDEMMIKEIAKYNTKELLSLVMSAPEYLTDGYYGKFRTAINKRYDELVKEGLA